MNLSWSYVPATLAREEISFDCVPVSRFAHLDFAQDDGATRTPASPDSSVSSAHKKNASWKLALRSAAILAAFF